METLHHISIITHVIAGTLALVAGFMAAVISKKNAQHKKVGWFFVYAMTIVVVTGLIGVFVFGRNNFLLVITLLSGYNCFSGIRVMQLRGRKPLLADYLASLLVLGSAFYYVYYVMSSGLYWSPVVVYSTIGALCMITFFDLSRALMPVTVLKKTRVYEHVYKMFGALSGLADAFAGTVLPQYQPYSQFVPSLIALVIVIIIFIRMGSLQLMPGKDALLQQPN